MPATPERDALLLRELSSVTSDLAELHRNEHVAFVAWRKSFLGTYTSMMLNEGKSATEAKVWAEASAVVLQDAHLKIRADIAALNERRFYLDVALRQ